MEEETIRANETIIETTLNIKKELNFLRRQVGYVGVVNINIRKFRQRYHLLPKTIKSLSSAVTFGEKNINDIPCTDKNLCSI